MEARPVLHRVAIGIIVFSLSHRKMSRPNVHAAACLAARRHLRVSVDGALQRAHSKLATMRPTFGACMLCGVPLGVHGSPPSKALGTLNA